MSLIKERLAVLLTSVNAAGKEIAGAYVPTTPPVGYVAPKQLKTVQRVIPRVRAAPVEKVPEPEIVEEPIPPVEVFFDSEVVVAEPVPSRRLALRALKAGAPTTTPIQQAIAALTTSMTNFGPVFVNGVENTKVQEAALADTALELGGLNNAGQISAMQADLDAHALTDGASHNVTPLQAGTYSQTQVNTQLAARPTYNALPLSRYGELSYLPVGVSGSFQGATTNLGTNGQNARNYPCIVEDDGTLVYLRNGTNGSSVGVYYAYSKNIMTATPLQVPVRTNRAYAPSWFPVGLTAQYVTRGDLAAACIFGRLQDSTGTAQQWFLSLTHGTFDDTKHTGCLLAAATAFSIPASCYPEVIVGNSAVFIIIPQSVGPTGVLEWQVWTIPLASIASGNTVVPTQITGWTMTGWYAAIAATNMRLAAAIVGPASSQPMVVQDPATTGFVSIVPFYPNQMGVSSYSAQDPASGNIRTRIMAEFVVSDSQDGEQIVWNTYFTFLWNPTTKTGNVEAPYTTPANVTTSGGRLALSGSIIAATRFPTSTNNWFTGETMYYHPSGYWVSVVDQAVADNACYVARAKLTNATNKFTALIGTQPCTGQLNTSFLPSYGSAVGGTIMGSYQLPGNRVMVHCTGTNAAGAAQRDLVLVQRGADNTAYKSQFNGSFTGYAPDVYRHFLTDLGLVPGNYVGIISEINTAGTVNATGAWYMEGLQSNGFVSIDQNLVKTGATALSTTAIYATVKTAMFAALGIAAATVTDSRVSLVVPQNASIPPFALLTWIDTSLNERVATGELSITSGSRAGTIASFGLVTVSPAVTIYTEQASTFQPTLAFAAEFGGITIYETADSWLIGGFGKHFISRVVFTGSYTFQFAVPKSTNRPDWTTVSYVVEWGTIESNFPTAVPGHGFGLNLQTQVSSDGETKLIFAPYATDLASFKTWAQQAQANWRVQTSQDVAQGWIVYFTDDQPLIMNGTFHQMQPQTIDLTTIKANPASTTFYAYIVVTGGVPAYVISTTDQAESPTVMFIGTIVTGAAAITSTNMVKVTRISNYRVTPTRGGSSIAVSAGTPDTTAALAWK